MPKRSAAEKIEYYSAKISKLQQKSNKRRRLIVYSSSSDSEDKSDNGAQAMEHNEMPPLTPMSPQNLCVTPPVPDTNEEPILDLDPELLQALGDAVDDVPVYGPNIHPIIAQRWLPILKKGVSQEAKEKMLSQYSFPENCKLLKSPSLNVELSAAVSDLVRNRDKKLQTNQDQLGLGITAVSRAITLLLTGDDKIKAVKVLSDGCRILSDLHFTQTQIRTKLITPGLEKSFLSVIKDEDRDETLFGSNLSEKIKAARAIEKQGLQLKKTTVSKPSTSSTPTAAPHRLPPRYQGNWSAPPRSSRGGRTSTHRSPAATPTTSRPYRRSAPTMPLPGRPSTYGSNKRV